MNNHTPTPDQLDDFRGIVTLGLSALVTDYVKDHPEQVRHLYAALAILSVDTAFWSRTVTAATTELIDQVDMTMGQRLATMADRMIDRMAESSKSSSRIVAFFDVLDEAEADPSALARRRLLDFMEILDRALTIKPCDVDFMEADTAEDEFEDGCSFGASYCDYGDGFDAGRFISPRVLDALIRYESEALAGFLGRGQRPEVQAELVAAAKVWRERPDLAPSAIPPPELAATKPAAEPASRLKTTETSVADAVPDGVSDTPRHPTQEKPSEFDRGEAGEADVADASTPPLEEGEKVDSTITTPSTSSFEGPAPHNIRSDTSLPPGSAASADFLTHKQQNTSAEAAGAATTTTPTHPNRAASTSKQKRGSRIEAMIRATALSHPDWGPAQIGKYCGRAESVVRQILGAEA